MVDSEDESGFQTLTHCRRSFNYFCGFIVASPVYCLRPLWIGIRSHGDEWSYDDVNNDDDADGDDDDDDGGDDGDDGDDDDDDDDDDGDDGDGDGDAVDVL